VESTGQSLLPWTSHLFASLTPGDLIAITLALLLIRLARYAGMWIFALVALPGTALHELSHFAVALVLGARPSFPSLLPTRIGRVWRLGEVRFQPGHLRAMFVALAPLLLAPFALWWALTFVAHTTWPWYALHVWIVAALLHACFPSTTDWRLAFPAIAVLSVLSLLLAAYYFFVR
jgi:hypothetical protein